MAAGSYLPIHPLLITSHCPPASLSALHPSTLCYWGATQRQAQIRGNISQGTEANGERTRPVHISLLLCSRLPHSNFLSPPRNPCDPFSPCLPRSALCDAHPQPAASDSEMANPEQNPCCDTGDAAGWLQPCSGHCCPPALATAVQINKGCRKGLRLAAENLEYKTLRFPPSSCCC